MLESIPNTQTDTTFVYLISAVLVTNPNRVPSGAGSSSIHQQSIKDNYPLCQEKHIANPAHTPGLRRIRSAKDY
jgi:hypothetical protein